MKKQLIAIGAYILAFMMCFCVLTGCSKNTSTKNQGKFKAVEQVGQVPKSFKNIVKKDAFKDVTAFDDRLLKTETDSDRKKRTATHRVWMMDLYGKTLATYTCSTDDAYHVKTLTATKDGGFLFVLGFVDYEHEQGKWASDDGFASRVIKCDKNGKVQFDTALDQIEGMALEYCFEKNGKFYFFGQTQTPETKTRGIYSPTDIYMVIIDKNGSVLKSQLIAGSDFDDLHAAEISNDDFILTIQTQSRGGDFEGATSTGNQIDWVFTVNDNLEIIDKEEKSGREFFDCRIGQKNGVAIFRSDLLSKDFDAGDPTAFIDYGDFYLVVSDNVTGEYENTPHSISSIWYYSESVYSAYDRSGNLIFRASIDSSPDYDALAKKFK